MAYTKSDGEKQILDWAQVAPGDTIQATFWSVDSYSSFEDAASQGAAYLSEACLGRDQFLQAMRVARCALTCFDGYAERALRISVEINSTRLPEVFRFSDL